MTENQKLREALQVAHDHIDMWSLEISHCKDAALIREALALPTAAPESLEAYSRKLDTQTPELEVSEIAAGFSDLSCGSAKAYDFDSFLEGANFAEQKLRNAAALALPTADQNLYLDGVNVERLKRAMSVAGCSADPSLEGLAADLSSHINRLTAAVVNLAQTAAPVGELPELPLPTSIPGFYDLEARKRCVYTADQMRAYARAALDAAMRKGQL